MDPVVHSNKLQYSPALPCLIKTVESKNTCDVKRYKHQVEIQQQEIKWMRLEMKALQELIRHKDGLISHYEQIAGTVLNSEEQLIDAAKKLCEQETIIDSMRAKE
jgi:hypothetical protein